MLTWTIASAQRDSYLGQRGYDYNFESRRMESLVKPGTRESSKVRRNQPEPENLQTLNVSIMCGGMMHDRLAIDIDTG